MDKQNMYKGKRLQDSNNRQESFGLFFCRKILTKTKKNFPTKNSRDGGRGLVS